MDWNRLAVAVDGSDRFVASHHNGNLVTGAALSFHLQRNAA